MTTLATLNLLLLGANFGISLLLLLVSFRQPSRLLSGAAAGVVLATLCLVIANRLDAPWRDTSLHRSLLAVAASGVFWLWLFCRVQFEERFALRGWHLPVLGALVGASLLTPWLREGFPEGPRVPLALLISVGLGLDLAWRMARDRAGDLLEPRRQVRVIFIAVLLSVPLLLFLLRRLGGQSLSQLEPQFVQSLTLLSLKIVIAPLLLEWRFVPLQPPATGSAEEAAAASPAFSVIQPGDAGTDQSAAALAALRLGMQEGRLYRQTGLSIGALAGLLGLPEYRLRRLINQHLGYRNFNDFLNEWRLREACSRLRDPAEARLPILSIALDVGFGSIGPFNRAFKQRFGITPSEFRQGREPVSAA